MITIWVSKIRLVTNLWLTDHINLISCQGNQVNQGMDFLEDLFLSTAQESDKSSAITSLFKFVLSGLPPCKKLRRFSKSGGTVGRMDSEKDKASISLNIEIYLWATEKRRCAASNTFQLRFAMKDGRTELTETLTTWTGEGGLGKVKTIFAEEKRWGVITETLASFKFCSSKRKHFADSTIWPLPWHLSLYNAKYRTLTNSSLKTQRSALKILASVRNDALLSPGCRLIRTLVRICLVDSF